MPPRYEHDTYLCQVCARVFDGDENPSEWRPDVTGHEGAGNVCPECMRRWYSMHMQSFKSPTKLSVKGRRMLRCEQ